MVRQGAGTMSPIGSRLRGLLLFLRRDSSSRSVPANLVAPWLYVGPALDRAGYAALAAHGVTHVVDLREEDSDDVEVMQTLGLAWRRFPTPDRTPPAHADLDAAIEWIETGAAAGDDVVDGVVYVHCSAGVSRSPTFAMALLMRRGLTLAEAHRRVPSARPAAAPTAEQLAWLPEVERRGALRRS
jgi:protein-tyrosine phosphatase